MYDLHANGEVARKDFSKIITAFLVGELFLLHNGSGQCLVANMLPHHTQVRTSPSGRRPC